MANGIPLPDGSSAPTGTFYADDSTLIARSPEHAVALYDSARMFCARSGAKIHPGKCVAIATGPAAQTLPNGIRILAPTKSTILLGIPVGTELTRAQQIEGVVCKMLQRCSAWQHIGRTLKGRVTVARSIILPTAWYQLSALATSIPEAIKIQRLINNYLNRATEFSWDGPQKRGNLPASL